MLIGAVDYISMEKKEDDILIACHVISEIFIANYLCKMHISKYSIDNSLIQCVHVCTATEGTDLFTVLVHELGHALGLTHSSARQSVMRPYYQGPLGDPLHFSLGHHDLQHITALYGNCH